MRPEEREREAELVQGLKAGEPDAFDRFIDHFRPRIFQYSWLMCHDREDAEEIAQEALLKVFQNLDQLSEPRKVRPWVFRIARNACLMKRRKSQFAPARELSLDEFIPAADGSGESRRLQIADWFNVPESELLRSELHRVLRHAIGELPDSYRPVLLLRDVEGLSTSETAETLDISEDLVKQRLHRARLAVRRNVDDYLRMNEAPALQGTREIQ